MLSWEVVGLFTHSVMTIPGLQVLFQSQKEEKAFDLVEYARILYDQSDPDIKQAFPLLKPLLQQPSGKLIFAHGGEIIGIPHGAHQVRSYHPWGLFNDESLSSPTPARATTTPYRSA
jgi:hypothetical protein